jgi:hypothetical protein
MSSCKVKKMKMSEMIRTLKQAQKQFGDVDVKLMDSETGNWIDVKTILKIHPIGANGCTDRKQPVNAVGISDLIGHANDLILN